MQFRWTLPVVAVLGLAADTPVARADDASRPKALQDYIALPQPKFAWKLVGSVRTGDGVIHECRLTSQEWQGILWKHALYLYEPNTLATPNHCLLFVTGGRTGGSPGLNDVQMGMTLAKLSGGLVAVLHHVPNQPLLGDHVEDDLITETFLKYLETKDTKWPLLFPMANSAVKAMDAIQQLSESQWNRPVKTFCVTGASKRGWTTWLSGVVDKRVIGIAPIVIDTLHFRPQMQKQKATWGKYSEQIDDYTRKGLLDILENQPDHPLFKWVDPYTYRDQLTMPKLIVNGTNDPYWVVDALNTYWDDLKGEKHVHYVPNGNHGLQDGKDGSGRDRALATIAVFSYLTATGKTLPKLSWKHARNDLGRELTIECTDKPKQATLWTATSNTKDFRPARWKPAKMTGDDKTYVGKAPKPATGHYAVHGAVEYLFNKVPFVLSTQIEWE